MALRTPVSTDQAPAAIGPYSQAIRTGSLLFCSGQIPLDPSTGEIVKSDVEGQARRCLENLSAVCEAAGVKDVLAKSLVSSNHANVVKATLAALGSLRMPDEILRMRGKKVAVKAL